jgi:MFS superfamily sulfate permease-like transporter
MSRYSDGQTFFTKWFDLLAKHKLGGALLPVSGISIGYFLALSGHIMPFEFGWYVSFLGAFMIAFCILLFLLFAAIFLYKSSRNNIGR